MKNANPVCPSFRWWLLALLALVFAGCDKSEPATAASDAIPKPATEFFEIRVGDKVVRMQLAVLPGEMERGLMGRLNLGRDEGMLFVYEKPQRLSFWMRNTPTPLDIGFFNDGGMLEEIYPMHPFDETAVRSRSTLLSLALEMNQGWFSENGVRPGAQIDLKALAAALKARGFAPEKFRLER